MKIVMSIIIGYEYHYWYEYHYIVVMSIIMLYEYYNCFYYLLLDDIV
jgi:hypothetical protein